ncbi:MAG: hypothetical protein ACI9VM_000742 [Candidatus Azotimanducaceae bacterium]|jgi:hypothetical protein
MLTVGRGVVNNNSVNPVLLGRERFLERAAACKKEETKRAKALE